jgi:clan AA aspartic protease
VHSGRVNTKCEAVVRLWIRGPSGQALETEAVVDTGFSGFLTLPQSCVTRLGLLYQGQGGGLLANGTRDSFEVYEAIALWHGKSRVISVHAVESDPLLGIAMLYGSEFAMQVVEGGEVAIHELPLS